MLLATKNKHHQAEKPIELYEYLIRNFTEEQDICLDQFGGSCNMLQASVNLNRFAIVYEISKEFVTNAVKRFNMITLYNNDIQPKVEEEIPIQAGIPALPADTEQFVRSDTFEPISLFA